MDEKKKLNFVLVFTIGYLILFTVLAVFHGNYEFLYYALVMSGLLVLIAIFHLRFYMTGHIITGLSILGFLHVAGGNIHIAGTRLYDIYLIGSFFKYDNLVHSFGIFVATFIGYNFLIPHLDQKIKYHRAMLAVILVAVAMGFGSFNEILEFFAVLYLDAGEAVGGYFNNAWDLFYNLMGSIAALVFIHFHRERERSRRKK